MFKTYKKLLAMLMFVGLMSLSTAGFATDSTPEEAMAMARKAAEYVHEHGEEAAAAEFNKKESDFIHNDLYVFVVDEDGVFLAHPIKSALVGKNMIALKDVEGTPLIKNFTEVDGEGWSPYKWPHPVTKKIRPKKSYIINVDGFILGVGTYYVE